MALTAARRADRGRANHSAAQVSGVDDLLRSLKAVLLAILLNPGRTQTGEAMLIDRVLPGKEFLNRQGIAAAGFLQRQQSAADRGDDFGLAANDPALRSGCRQISNRQRRTVRPDDILDPRAMGFSHNHSHTLDNATDADFTQTGLKFG